MCSTIISIKGLQKECDKGENFEITESFLKRRL